MDDDSRGGSPPDKNSNLSTTLACLQAMEVVRNTDITYEIESIENQVVSQPSSNSITNFKRLNTSPIQCIPPKKIINNTNNITNQPNISTVNNNLTLKTPYELNKNNRFDEIDQEPYHVIIESTKNNIGNLHYMSLKK